MNNFLDNGTVLPHGLLSCDPADFNRALNKTYNNSALRFGVIKKIYSINDPNNISKLTTEYDVEVIEQDMNRGVAPITYKNCLTVDSLGSIADFFEKNFRVQTQTDNQALPLTKGQNGATVLVLCLDATTGKGVIVGGLNHPNRQTTLVDTQPRLQGEYNGVNVNINPDGSTSLTFKGATDSYGDPVDASQGNTVVNIATDGSFSVTHSTITMNLARSGDITITATGNINVNNKGVTNIIAEGTTTIDGSTIKLGINAVESVIKGDTFRDLYNAHTHIGNLGQQTSPPLVIMDPSLSEHVFTE